MEPEQAEKRDIAGLLAVEQLVDKHGLCQCAAGTHLKDGRLVVLGHVDKGDAVRLIIGDTVINLDDPADLGAIVALLIRFMV